MRAEGRRRATVRFAHIEGFRGILALYVTIGHLFPLADPNAFLGYGSTAPAWFGWLAAPFAHGHFAVAAFIVVSGFCLQMALFDRADHGKLRDRRKWFGRRARRIGPPYYAALILSLLVMFTVTNRYSGVPPFDRWADASPEAIAAHFAMVHNLRPDWMYRINGVLWSIAFEAQLYLLFPFLNKALMTGGRAWALGLSTAAAILLAVLVPQGGKLYFWYLPLFVAGMASAHWTYRPPAKATKRPDPAKLFLLSAALYGAAIVSTAWGQSALMAGDVLFGLGTAVLFAMLAITTRGAVKEVLVRKEVVALGTMSYSLYLMHHPFAQVWYHWRPDWAVDPATRLGWMVIGLVPILFACFLFFVPFELPFLRRAAHRAVADPGAESLKRLIERERP